MRSIAMTDPRPHPPESPSLARLFRQCLVIGATSFGGGLNAYVRLIFVKRRRWVTEEEFLESLEVAQTLPGPNVVNLVVMLGRQLHGTAGAAVALVGLLGPAVAANALLVMFVLQRAESAAVTGVLAGFGAAAAGLSIANAGQMARVHLRRTFDILLTLVAAVTMIWLRPPLVVAIVVFGSIGVAAHYLRARRDLEEPTDA